MLSYFSSTLYSGSRGSTLIRLITSFLFPFLIIWASLRCKLSNCTIIIKHSHSNFCDSCAFLSNYPLAACIAPINNGYVKNHLTNHIAGAFYPVHNSRWLCICRRRPPTSPFSSKDVAMFFQTMTVHAYSTRNSRYE